MILLESYDNCLYCAKITASSCKNFRCHDHGRFCQKRIRHLVGAFRIRVFVLYSKDMEGLDSKGSEDGGMTLVPIGFNSIIKS